MRKFTLGFSSCPNDTFIFDALVHHRIDTRGLDFDVVIKDIEELNELAIQRKIDFTKISFNAYGKISKDYILCDSGSALGKNNGPLLVSEKKYTISDLIEKVIAIPGENTTANLLLSIAFPELKNKQSYLFSDIEHAILEHKIDAGLIIHENRFTYEANGLLKIIDLGEWWEKTWGKPLPLGGICAKRSLSKDILITVNQLIKESILFAFKNKYVSLPFVKKYAQAMNENVMHNHINLYVNAFTLDLGTIGKDAIKFFYKKAQERKKILPIVQPMFISDIV